MQKDINKFLGYDKNNNEIWRDEDGTRVCNIIDCLGKVYGNGYCSKHYQQIKKHGKTFRSIYTPNDISINKDHNYAKINLYDKHGGLKNTTIIDIEDVDKVKNFKWTSSTFGYVISRNQSENIFLHRLLMDCPDDMVVDHINRDRLDNRKSNLRICSSMENCSNMTIPSHNKSNTIGVCWNKEKQRWNAFLRYDGKKVLNRYFNNYEEAIKIRLMAEVYFFKEFAPQTHLFEQYGISKIYHENEYKFDTYMPQLNSPSGIVGVKIDSRDKSKWRVELKYNKKKVINKLCDTKEEAILIRLEGEVKYLSENKWQKHLWEQYNFNNLNINREEFN